jgi:hypothetical protein
MWDHNVQKIRFDLFFTYFQNVSPGFPSQLASYAVPNLPFQLAFLTMTNIRHFWVASNSR